MSRTAEQLRELLRYRLRHDLRTQRELASDIGVSPQFLSDVLRGKREPSGAILEFLSLERIVTYVRK